MEVDIADIVKGKLASLPFVDTLAGLVKPITYNTGEADKVVQKTIPVGCNVTHSDCINGKYKDLIPDSRKKSIIYFESRGTRRINEERGEYNFQTDLRLVCWLNQKKLGKTNCSVSALAITNILKAAKPTFFNSGIYTKIQITWEGEVIKDPDIFSKYTYPDGIVQFLMFPFDYFALDLSVKYEIPERCITDWTVSAESTCEDHTT